MTHVDEENVDIVQFDLLLQEYIKSGHNSEVFAIIQSPYLLNYRISSTWPSFTSNLFNVSDIDTLEDLLRIMRKNAISIKVLTLSPKHQLDTSLNNWAVIRQKNFVTNLYELGCQIFFSSKVHQKMTITSQGCLVSSANVTPTAMRSGNQWNAGDYFPKSMIGEYNEKLEYANKKFSDSNLLKLEDLLA